jgi:hypothetical protein
MPGVRCRLKFARIQARQKVNRYTVERPFDLVRKLVTDPRTAYLARHRQTLARGIERAV